MARNTKASKKTLPIQMACVTLGFEQYLLPVKAAMDVLEAMQQAVPCRVRYDDDRTYHVEQRVPNVEYTLVHRSQIRVVDDVPVSPEAPQRAEEHKP